MDIPWRRSQKQLLLCQTERRNTSNRRCQIDQLPTSSYGRSPSKGPQLLSMSPFGFESSVPRRTRLLALFVSFSFYFFKKVLASPCGICTRFWHSISLSFVLCIVFCTWVLAHVVRFILLVLCPLHVSVPLHFVDQNIKN
jgi:hypothetical protein